jgi:excisionase family DNA binding protein
MEEQLASVYGLKDRRNDEFFYIGMSTDPHSRYGEHLSLRGKARMSAKGLRILDMRKDGLLPELVIFEQDISAEYALDRERYWMNYHLGIGAPLTNIVIPREPSYSEEKTTGDFHVPSYTIGEVANLFQRSERYVYRLIVSGEISAFKIGASWHFDQEYIHSLVSHYSPADPPGYTEPEDAPKSRFIIRLNGDGSMAKRLR